MTLLRVLGTGVMLVVCLLDPAPIMWLGGALGVGAIWAAGRRADGSSL